MSEEEIIKYIVFIYKNTNFEDNGEFKRGYKIALETIATKINWDLFIEFLEGDK